LKIDIYGKCGDLKVPKKHENDTQDSGYLIVKKYKFYLSFENSLCTEYITEKFFNAMEYGAIPIGIDP
jgi:hypothetical protein